jgi:hypothetical protein
LIFPGKNNQGSLQVGTFAQAVGLSVLFQLGETFFAFGGDFP